MRARAADRERSLAAIEWLAEQEAPIANGSFAERCKLLDLVGEALRRGAKVYEACETLGFNDSLYYRWLDERLGLCKAVDRLMSSIPKPRGLGSAGP